MKLKLITAAIIMAASAQASAAIMSPYGGGDGEAMFNIWDPITQNSYTQDLGVAYSALQSNLANAAYSLNFSLDSAVYSSAFSGSDTADMIWNVSVGQNIAGDFSNFDNYGIIGTSKSSFTLNSFSLNGALVQHDEMSTAMRGVNPADIDPADNNAYHGTVANGAYAGDPGLWNTNWALTPVNNTAAIGEDMGFYFIKGDLAGNNTTTEAAGRWAFDGTNLTYGAVSAVPVPAAIWLFGSGLIGLVGVARRKTA